MPASKASLRLLFVSHAASANGASILLLHTLRWLAQHTSHSLHVLCLGQGPLLPHYREVATTHVLRNAARRLPGLPASWADALQLRWGDITMRMLLRRHRIDLVYANTAAVWPQVESATRAGAPVLWHIHELHYALGTLLPSQRSRSTLTSAKRLIAVSTPVADVLAQEYAVSAERIDVVQGFVEPAIASAAERSEVRRSVRSRMGWSEDDFVVGACGSLGWRKGSDLFLQAAARCRNGPGKSTRFLWVGGASNDTEARQFRHDIERLGLAQSCVHVPTTSDVLDFYEAMDVFALTSREDPFPLVMLEAGARGVPTVCFEHAGGGAQFVQSGAGLCVPYLDVEAFAVSLQHLRDDVVQRRSLGAGAQARVLSHNTIEHQLPRIAALLESVVARSERNSPDVLATLRGARRA